MWFRSVALTRDAAIHPKHPTHPTHHRLAWTQSTRPADSVVMLGSRSDPPVRHQRLLCWSPSGRTAPAQELAGGPHTPHAPHIIDSRRHKALAWADSFGVQKSHRPCNFCDGLQGFWWECGKSRPCNYLPIPIPTLIQMPFQWSPPCMEGL